MIKCYCCQVIYENKKNFCYECQCINEEPTTGYLVDDTGFTISKQTVLYRGICSKCVNIDRKKWKENPDEHHNFIDIRPQKYKIETINLIKRFYEMAGLSDVFDENDFNLGYLAYVKYNDEEDRFDMEFKLDQYYKDKTIFQKIIYQNREKIEYVINEPLSELFSF